MGEDDAEAAFMLQLQAEKDALADESDVDGSKLPSDTQQKEDVIPRPDTDDQVSRAPSLPTAEPDSDEDYEPPAFASVPAVTVAAMPSPPKKPRIVAGFIHEESDDEDDAPTPGSITSHLQVATNPRNISPSALAHEIVVEEPTGGSESVPVPTTITTSSQMLPKARLPHDRIGQFEDRIKEDPKGDVEAWLALIDEHRSRNKLDDARAVYERFFKVFPQAVSTAKISVYPD